MFFCRFLASLKQHLERMRLNPFKEYFPLFVLQVILWPKQYRWITRLFGVLHINIGMSSLYGWELQHQPDHHNSWTTDKPNTKHLLDAEGDHSTNRTYCESFWSESVLCCVVCFWRECDVMWHTGQLRNLQKVKASPSPHLIQLLHFRQKIQTMKSAKIWTEKSL